MLVTATHQSGQDVMVSFDKEALKQISSVANHPTLSNEANWKMVSIIFKHTNSSKRIASGFKNNFTKTDNVKLKANMSNGEVYELHEIIISGTNRQPRLSIKRSEITNASSMDLTLGGGNVAPDPVTLALSTTSNSVLQAFSVTAAFSESVTGFALSDISVTNGTASNLSGSGANYSFTVTPASDGQISVSVPQGSATASSNVSNNASNSLSITYYSPVSVTLSTVSNSVSQAFSVTAEFNKSITGFALEDISVTNGTASNLSGLGSSYTFDVTPSANGNVGVLVASDSVFGSGGETNTASNSLSVTYTELPGYRYYKFAAQKGWSSTTDLTTESNNISISEIAFKWDGEIQDMSSYGATVTNIKNPSYGANSNIFDNNVTTTYRNWVVGGNSYEDLFKIDLNVKKDVELITISAYNNASSIGNIPKAFKIYGSNNDNTWTEILSVNEADTSTWAKFVPYGRRPFNIGSYSSNLFTALTNSNWNSASNWLNNSVPNGSDAFAEFYRGHTHAVNLDADVSLDKLAFYYSNQTISSTSAKTLQISGTNKQIKSKVSSLAGMPIISTAMNLTNGANILGSDGYLRLSGTVNASGGTINNYSNYLDLTGASNNFASAIVNNYKNLYASSGSLAGGATINLNTTNNDVDFGATMATGSINFIGTVGKQITISGSPKATALSAPVTLGGTVDGTLRLYTSGAGMGLISASNITFGSNSKILVDSNTNTAEVQLPLNINSTTKIQVGSETSTANGAVPFARFNSGYTTISNPIDMVGSPDYVNGAAIRTYGTNATLNGNIVLDAKGTSKSGTKFLLSDYGTGDMIVTGNISNANAANASNCWLSIENTVRLEGTNSFTSPIEIGYPLAGSQAANLVVKSPINSNLVYMRNGTIQIETGVSSTAFDIDTISTNPKIFYSSVPNTGNLNIGAGATNFRLYPWIQSQSSAARAESVFTLNGNITVTAGGAAWSIYPTAASGNKMSKVVINGNITSSNALSVNISNLPIGTYTVMEYTGTWTGTPTFAISGTGNGTCSISHDAVTKKVTITRTA